MKMDEDGDDAQYDPMSMPGRGFSMTPEVSSFLEHCSRPHTDRIAEEFQHGFSLQTPKEAQQKLYGFKNGFRCMRNVFIMFSD